MGARHATLALVLAACGSSKSAPPTGTRVGPALTAALAAASELRAPWRCAAADGPRLVDEQLALGARTWKLAGDTVTLDAAAPTFTIAVIADAGGAAPATLAALGRLRTQLADADLVVTLGGMGATQPELEATLAAIASPRAPVVALPGDLEPVSAQTAAIKALRARGHAVIDGRLARRIELPGITLATVPGARAAARLAGGADGCSYTAADVGRLLDNLRERHGLRILATAESPRQIDADGEPVGEPAVTPGAQQEVDLVLHAPTSTPSLARTGTRDGRATPLTPGTADATTRLPGPRRPPSAALLVITGDTWRWKPIVDPT